MADSTQQEIDIRYIYLIYVEIAYEGTEIVEAFLNEKDADAACTKYNEYNKTRVKYDGTGIEWIKKSQSYYHWKAQGEIDRKEWRKKDDIWIENHPARSFFDGEFYSCCAVECR